jgi:hypothetical protein
MRLAIFEILISVSERFSTVREDLGQSDQLQRLPRDVGSAIMTTAQMWMEQDVDHFPFRFHSKNK